MNTSTVNRSKLRKKTVSEIVSEDYRTASIFKSLDMDFCCGGKKPLAEACDKQGVNTMEVIDRILALEDKERKVPYRFQAWSPNYLIDYIIETHHSYVTQKIPEIRGYLNRVCKVHGERHPELEEIRGRFEKLSSALLNHLRFEEETAFPYIKWITTGGDGQGAKKAVSSIDVMEEEHREAGDLMKEIRGLSDEYTPPQNACPTYRVLYANLEEFEDDLHHHVHLENNILFPKVEAMIR